MVNVKKKKAITSYFIFLLTFFLITSCTTKSDVIYEIKTNQINVNEKVANKNSEVEDFVTPYRNHINEDLDNILAYNPIDQDKSKGEWETNIGNLLAKITFDLATPVFYKRENKSIDACMLNHGGIRAVIPKGNVTTRTAFNVMPFENSVIIVGLTGKEIEDLAQYMLTQKKPHPLYGITIYTNNDASKVNRIEINNKPINLNQTYYIATSDYLANGGDSMVFFKNSTIKYDLDYKLRNLFIDHFKKVDVLPNITTKHIIKE